MTATKPDAVVEERHREQVAECFLQTRNRAYESEMMNWVKNETPHMELPIMALTLLAQALANLEAAVRAEYAGVVRAAEKVLRLKLSHEAREELRIALETLKNG